MTKNKSENTYKTNIDKEFKQFKKEIVRPYIENLELTKKDLWKESFSMLLKSGPLFLFLIYICYIDSNIILKFYTATNDVYSHFYKSLPSFLSFLPSKLISWNPNVYSFIITMVGFLFVIRSLKPILEYSEYDLLPLLCARIVEFITKKPFNISSEPISEALKESFISPPNYEGEIYIYFENSIDNAKINFELISFKTYHGMSLNLMRNIQHNFTGFFISMKLPEKKKLEEFHLIFNAFKYIDAYKNYDYQLYGHLKPVSLASTNLKEGKYSLYTTQIELVKYFLDNEKLTQEVNKLMQVIDPDKIAGYKSVARYNLFDRVQLEIQNGMVCMTYPLKFPVINFFSSFKKTTYEEEIELHLEAFTHIISILKTVKDIYEDL